MVESSRSRLAPRRRPWRALTKEIEFVRFEPDSEGVRVLLKDQWQFYKSHIPNETLRKLLYGAEEA